MKTLQKGEGREGKVPIFLRKNWPFSNFFNALEVDGEHPRGDERRKGNARIFSKGEKGKIMLFHRQTTSRKKKKERSRLLFAQEEES